MRPLAAVRPRRPRGNIPSSKLPNRYAIAVAKALPIAFGFTQSAAAQVAIAMLEGVLLRARDARGRPFLAAPCSITGRAAGIARRHGRRIPDLWMVRSTGEIAAWLACWREGGQPAPCTAAASDALRKIDPKWPDLLCRMEAALMVMPTTRARPFELARLPNAAARFIAALGRAE